MNLKNSLWQFIKDSSVGVVVTLIPFAILAPIFILQGNTDWSEFFGSMFFFQNSFLSPMPFVILIGFISMGIGGRFLENITSRWSWIKPILIIVVIAWIIPCTIPVVLFIEHGFLDSDVLVITITLGITALGAGVGFVIAGLVGVIFNPTNRLFRSIIGAIASTVVAYSVGLLIFASNFLSMING